MPRRNPDFRTRKRRQFLGKLKAERKRTKLLRRRR